MGLHFAWPQVEQLKQQRKGDTECVPIYTAVLHGKQCCATRNANNIILKLLTNETVIVQLATFPLTNAACRQNSGT